MSPAVRLPCRSCRCKPCLTGTKFSLDSCTATRIETAPHREDPMHLRNCQTCICRFGELLIGTELGQDANFPIGRIELIQWLAFLDHSACKCWQPRLEKGEDVFPLVIVRCSSHKIENTKD